MMKKIILTALIFAVLFPLAASGYQKIEDTDKFNNPLTYYVADSFRPEGGITVFGWQKFENGTATRVLDKVPYLFGLELIEKGQYEKALLMITEFREFFTDKERVDLCTRMAELGYAKAQFRLGEVYSFGKLVPQDHEEAVKWFLLAAKQGEVRAQNALGLSYSQGIGCKQNYAEAVKWFEKAADQGSKRAQNSLGIAYFEGLGVEQDFTKAFEYFRKAAKKGVVYAENALGDCYYYGLGVARDYEKAVEWYMEAADHNYTDALINLGWCYKFGTGVAKNEKKAEHFFRLAEEAGAQIKPR